VKPISVKDPRGVEWHLMLTHEVVTTQSLERAVERSGMSEKDKKKRRAHFGIPEQFGLPFRNYRWRFGWGRAHSGAWVMHAVTRGEHRAWLSPQGSRHAALADLDELAAQIRLGEEPQATHEPS
jgi:hypothetical protein